jgi:membrane protease YdiL (CAAX protease family)
MSKDSSEAGAGLPWNGWLGAAAAILIFFAAQFAGSFLLSVYPLLKGWSVLKTQAWLSDNLAAQLIYLAVANVIIFGGVWLFLRHFKSSFRSIGLTRPKAVDALYSLGALPVYFIALALSVTIIKYLVPALDLNQAQDLGFNGTYGAVQLALIAVSLVILPPLTEEVIFRGVIFTSLKKKMSVIGAALVTSLLFALGHLPEGGSGGPLYIAAIDTFILSLILVYLRQKTGRLWASMGLHALKNGIAFVSLFVIHLK